MITDWNSLGSTYAEGAKTTTSGKPLHDGNVDLYDRSFGGMVRKQNHWLNVNTTDIPTIVQSTTARTIGVSLTVQVESPDLSFNDAAETFLERFHEIGAGELTNKHHFNSAMRAISDFDVLDGGIIIRHHYNPVWDMPYKYELVSVDMIDIARNSHVIAPNGESTTSGLVKNKWGQITHVWLYSDFNKRTSERVSMENITYYSEVWVSLAQQTAVSKLASLLPTLDRIDQYARAELESAIESAKAGAYLKSTAYNEIMMVAFDEINKLQSLGDKTTEIKNILQTLAKAGIKPQGLTPIPSGDDVLFPTQARHSVYKELTNTSETKMASSQGMSAISMYGKAEEANYSAIKYAAETDQLSANIRFDNISNKVIREIHKRAIQVGIQIGEIPSRVAYWKNPAKFNRFSYLRNVTVDIEPAKNADANQINIGLGLKTPKEIVEQRTGRKYEDFLTEKIKAEIFEIQLRKKLFEEAKVELPQPQETTP